MAIQSDYPKAESTKLPAGLAIQPRKFDFDDLEAVPQYWFLNNPILTNIENVFSIIIPAGERFFIRSVRSFEGQVTDPEQKGLIKAFMLQEGLHSQAHTKFNNSMKNFGVDVDRETKYFEKVLRGFERRLPKKTQLGMTAFLEHLTAAGAHGILDNPEFDEMYAPEMLSFWRWHAVEELEHRAVAFDLLKVAKIGYFHRVFSAILVLILLAAPVVKIFRRIMKDDSVTVTREMVKQARETNRKLMGPQVRMSVKYFKPGFHPWDIENPKYLKAWYAAQEATAPEAIALETIEQR